jgi:LuxR family transcriptional regulator, maltose regulon positive regulatory protein
MVKAVVPPAHAVDRPALRRQLDEALDRPLTLIVAPAGAGKSVLLTQWAATHPDLAFVRMDLTPSDDDPVRFCQRLFRALGAASPDAGELGSVVSVRGAGLGPALLELVVSNLAGSPETVIVFDDLHQLSNAELIADLGHLVALVPDNVHLVLSTRVDPPIAWSRHRLLLGLTEIRQAELAFDGADSSRLLERITGLQLTSDQVDALVTRTEGWATGLQLAGMMLRLHGDPERFIAQFSGSDRLIADYLSEEVLGAQPESRRRLLLHISVLDEMCADLVSCLTGEAGAQQVLEDLERESMFLVPLDDRRQWFRFHHLFRDLLRFRLRAEEPGAEARLLGQAADWHLRRGEVGPAVEYLTRAERWPDALDLIMARGSEVFERGEMATVIRWIGAVPENARSKRRDISLLLGVLMGAEGQAPGAEDVLRRVVADPGASPGERACAQVFLASLAQWRPNPDTSVQMAVHALALLAGLDSDQIPNLMNLSDPQSLETMALISGGRAHFLAGHMEQARQWLDRGLTSSGAAYSVWRVSGLGSLSLLEAWTGRVERAEALADEALAIARDVGTLSHPSTADAYLAVSLAALERGEPRRAALSLREGTLRAEANRRTPLIWVARLQTALLQAADGHPDLAGATIHSARHETGAPPPPVVADGLVALRSRLLRVAGAPHDAWRALKDTELDTPPLVFEGTACALALGHLDWASKILDGVPLPGAGEPLPQVERQVLSAWLASAEGQPQRAGKLLEGAMDVAEGHGLIEVFVRGGPAVVRLVDELTDDQPAFREAVLARAREAMAPAPRSDLADPLTDRELEILSYLPSRFTNTELAAHCYVSVNTIKTHMAHIYRKLEVANRNEAIVRARELGLL